MKYRRLPGKKGGIASLHTLWMGDDHLLSVDSNSFSERYTRYYFKDIKAVYTRKTSAGKSWNIILFSGLSISLISLFFSLGDGATPGVVLLGVLSAILTAAVLANIMLGPTCICHIHMPIGISELPSLRRIKRVRKAMDLIRPRIEALQGALAPEEIRAVSSSAVTQLLPPGRVSRTARPAGAESKGAVYRGVVHLAAFSLLMLEAILGLATLRYDGRGFLAVCVLLTLVLFAFLVMAVVRQSSAPVPRPAGRLVWTAILIMAAAVLSGYYAGIFFNAMSSRGSVRPDLDMTGILASVMSQPFYPYLILAFSLCLAAIGALGLLSCLRWRAAAAGASGEGKTAARGGAQ